MTIKSWALENSISSLPSILFESANATPVKNPSLFVFNTPLAKLLELDELQLDGDVGISWLSGNSVPPNTTPIAQAYAGHQFARFVPSLGDGRAVLLGEHRLTTGELFDIQLKGSGRTVYSRNGDGRAALGPMLREYIIGEFLTAVGIPATRALAVVLSGESIQREKLQAGAVLTRVADSHIRIGTFEYLHARSEKSAISQLVNYCISRHYPECRDSQNPAFSFCKQFVEKTASLVSQWMHVGFIHGVLNTDNVAISGQSLDFGPCAFMDTYDPATVFSSIDTAGRYAYGAQPSIMHWNVARFLETVLFLLDEDQAQSIEKAKDLLQHFETIFEANWNQGLRNKLGLHTSESNDHELGIQFLNLLFENKLDFTHSFRMITSAATSFGPDHPLTQWHTKWRARIEETRNARTLEETFVMMQKQNPIYIPRNHIVEAVLSSCQETHTTTELDKLISVLRAPFTEKQNQDSFSSLPPKDWTNYRTFCGT